MKKLLLSALALVALVACNHDEVVREQSPSFITFGDSFVENKTRAAVDPSFNNETTLLKAFDVWGFINEPTGVVFNQERVTKGENGWSYQNLQYWTAENEYFFYAVAPVDDSNIVVNTDMNRQGLGNIAFTNDDGTTDLLYSSQSVETGSEFPYHSEKVTMQFMHLLSKIKFTFKNAFTNENASLAVKNIKITDAPKAGNIDVNKSRLDFVWNVEQGATLALDFGNANGGNMFASSSSAESDVERLTIPADATRSYSIEFDLELYFGDQPGMTSHKSLTLEGQAFEIGKNYNLVAEITPDNFAEEALKPIEFDVKVEDWTEGEFTGKFDENDNTTEDPEQPVDPEQPEVTPGEASEWALVGAFSGWADKTMLTTADADVVVLEDVAMKAAEGFLVRKPATEWADKYGAGNVNYIKANHYITTAKDGGDMCLEADGTYDVYFNIATKNLYVMEADANYADAAEQKVNGEEPKQEEPEVTEKVVYLKPNANWTTDGARFAAYFWNDGGNAWVSMTAVEEGIYKVNLPEGYDYGCSVIFCRMNPNTAANNWSNKWNQTGDLKVPTDGKNLFTLAASAWDGATTSWGTYTPAVAEPVALATPVVTAEVAVNVITLTWEAVENAAQYSITVGTEMPVFVEDTTYVFTGEYETEYTFNVVAVPADEEKFAASEAAVVTATTEAEPVEEPTYTTVAEFLAAEEDDTIYTLNGTITSVTQTTYGNFYLMDDTGEVLIYGLCSPEGAAQYWAASGAKVGDDITVKTVRTSYGGSPQGKNAIFVDLVSPGTRAFWTFDATAVSFAAAAAAKTINVSLYNAKDEVKVASDNAQFTAAYADGVLTISAAENTTPEKIEGTVTISCGTLSQEISVSQNGASTGDKEEVTATLTFDSTSKRTAFSTSSQTWTENGITFVNEKNKSTNNIADYSKPVRCYQGSRIIVSVEGEISTIVFDCNSSSYATALKNSVTTGEVSVSSDKVTVKLDGEASFTIDQLTAQSRIDAVTVTYMK